MYGVHYLLIVLSGGTIPNSGIFLLSYLVMASGRVENGKTLYLTPIAAVRDFFESLTDLKSLSRTRDLEKQANDSEKYG